MNALHRIPTATLCLLSLFGVAADVLSQLTADKDAVAATSSDPLFAMIVEAVQENENRYRNLETVVTHETQRDPAIWSIPKTVETFHTVQQGELTCFRSEVPQPDGGQPRVERLSAFDGEQTRTIEYGNSANIHPFRYEPSQLFPRHSWALYQLHVNFPLSIYLQGTAALPTHPKVRRFPVERGSIYEFHKVECEYAGEELLDGLRCHKIRCRRWY
ncbi:MAG: hypothetical protein WD669_04810 [Pirellulales bacterium]